MNCRREYVYSRGEEKLLAFNSDKLMPADVCRIFSSVALRQNLEQLIESKINRGGGGEGRKL